MRVCMRPTSSRTPQAPRRTRSCTRIKARFELSPINRARQGKAGGARERSECRHTSKRATSMVMYKFLQQSRKVHTSFATDANMSWRHCQHLCTACREATMRGSPGREAVGIQRLMEVPLVVIQHAQARTSAPELANHERQRHEGGQRDRDIYNVNKNRSSAPTAAQVGPTQQTGLVLLTARSCS